MLALYSQEAYERHEIKAHIAAYFTSTGGFAKMFSDKKRVLLKPNFVVPEDPQGGATTHPDFYMAIAEFFLEQGCHVGIGESPAFGSCRKALKFHNVLDECQEKGIEIVEFNKNENYSDPQGEGSYKNLSIARELQNWDALVNLPKLKVHQQFVFSAATKNLYGCVTGSRKFIRHNMCKNDPVRFARMVMANAKKAAAVLHIGDGIEALHVKGPRGGEKYPLGKIIISQDYLSHDWLYCLLTDLDPMKTPLFLTLNKNERQELHALCQPLVEQKEFCVAENFIQSYRTDISFSPWHILRSQWRSLKFKIRRAK